MHDIESALAPVVAFSPKALDAKKAEIAEAADVIGAMRVDSPESLEVANAWLGEVVAERKAIDEMRTGVTKPLNVTLRQINGWFKPMADRLGVLERKLKTEIAQYTAGQRQLQAEQYQAAVASHAAGQHEAAREALAVASTAQTTTPAGTNVREVWAAEIINPAMIPHAYLIPNEKAIQAHARTTPIDQDPAPIAGVRFVKRPIVTVRGAK